MNPKEWKETYIELDAYYRDFVAKWRVADFRYPEQIKENEAALANNISFTYDVVFINDELREMLLEGMDYGQRYWMEETGMRIDTIYMRYMPILLHKIEQKIAGFGE
ncbi:MAG: hypothetical protein DI539_27055 [Flavobacterium psychrophilum]|nr:MAG: hypothetical protein DI539_27055 [Flavobacterium psychrophilum]